MDFKNLSGLFSEFLDMFKGQNLQNLGDILPNLGNAGMLEKILKGKYVKYLPLLPLLAKFNQEGFKGILNNADDIKNILSAVGDNENGILKDINIEQVIKFLPLLSQFFSRKVKDKEPPLLQTDLSYEKPIKVNINPLSCIAEIADKDIIYALNKYISRNNE